VTVSSLLAQQDNFFLLQHQLMQGNYFDSNEMASIKI